MCNFDLCEGPFCNNLALMYQLAPAKKKSPLPNKNRNEEKKRSASFEGYHMRWNRPQASPVLAFTIGSNSCCRSKFTTVGG